MNKKLAKIVGKNIRNKRRELNYTLIYVQRLTGVTQSFLSEIERGEELPSLSTATKIVKALGLTLNDIVKGSEENVKTS